MSKLANRAAAMKPLSLQEGLLLGLIRVGPFTEIEPNVEFRSGDPTVTNQIIVGANCRIASGTVIYPGVLIDDGCDIEHHVVLEHDVRIGADTYIGHGSILSRGVRLGCRNIVYANSVVANRTEIGDDNAIGPFAAIGFEPQDRRTRVSAGRILIGSRNVLREFVTIHLPTIELTEIGNDCFIMAYSHISHDARIGDRVVMANNCQIGGHTQILHDANLGLSCVVHQYTVIGAGAMIGMGSILTKDVPPYVTFISTRATKLNRVGLERRGKSAQDIQALAQLYDCARERPLGEAVQQREGGWWQADFEEFLTISRRQICDYSIVGASVAE
ncbi:MAG: hypothetical protein HYY30_02985 [Chloroflexi bacterium]|nr:hypothetical protein [Chloroflexota bacterium]